MLAVEYRRELREARRLVGAQGQRLDLVQVESENRPVGVFDTHDVWKIDRQFRPVCKRLDARLGRGYLRRRSFFRRLIRHEGERHAEDIDVLGFEKAIGVERVWTLEELLPQCLFVSMHCPLTDETRSILNARTLALLPQGAYLINTARGGLVDESALLAAVDTEQLAGAALDVVEREPLSNERLRAHPKLIITPHCAFYSVDAAPELRTKAAEEALRLARGQAPRNPVNRPFLKKPRLQALEVK